MSDAGAVPSTQRLRTDTARAQWSRFLRSLEVCARSAQIPGQRKEKAEWHNEHSNLDSAFEYARGPKHSPAVPDEQRWSNFLYRNLASMAPGYVFEYRFNAKG